MDELADTVFNNHVLWLWVPGQARDDVVGVAGALRPLDEAVPTA